MKGIKNILILFFGLVACTELLGQDWQAIGPKFLYVSMEEFYGDSINDYLYVGGILTDTNYRNEVTLMQYRGDSLLRKYPYERSIPGGSRINYITEFKGEVYFGGVFNTLNGKNYIGGLAKMKNDSFVKVTPGVLDTFFILCMKEHQGEFYIAGSYTDSKTTNEWAYIKTKDFKSLTPINPIKNSRSIQFDIADMHSYKGNLWATGNFYSHDSSGKPYGDDIQFFKDGNWMPPSGLYVQGNSALGWEIEEYRGELYIAGWFHKKEGEKFNGIVKYDGKYFYELGSGTNVDIFDMVVYKDQLIVAGRLNLADGLPVGGIAKWDGVRWCNLQNKNFHWQFDRLAVYRNNLYALGNLGKFWLQVYKWVGDPSLEDSCAAPAKLIKINPNQSLQNWALQQSISIYPNPAVDVLSINKLKNSGLFQYRIIDLVGREWNRGSLGLKTQVEIEIKNLPVGQYIIELYNEKARITKRFVKQ